MHMRNRMKAVLPLAAAVLVLVALPALAAEIPDQLPDTDGKPATTDLACFSLSLLRRPSDERDTPRQLQTDSQLEHERISIVRFVN